MPTTRSTRAAAYLPQPSKSSRLAWLWFTCMIKSLFEQLRSEGVRYLDLGGVSPIKGYADGVTYFKMGFSGRLVRFLGDYDLSNSRLLRFLFNSIVGGRFPR